MRDIWNYPTLSEYLLKRSKHGDAAKSIIYSVLNQIDRTTEGNSLTIESSGYDPEAYKLALLRFRELGFHVEILFKPESKVTIIVSLSSYFYQSQTKSSISV